MNTRERQTHYRNPAHCPPTVADFLFLLAGAVAGVGVAWYAYEQSSSLPLALFAFAMVMYVVGAGPLHVLGMPNKLQRVVFVLLLPVCSGPVYWAVDARWDNAWIALSAGIILGGVVHRTISRMLLPALALDEITGRRRTTRPRDLVG